MLKAWMLTGGAGAHNNPKELERVEAQKRRLQLTKRLEIAINVAAGEDLFLAAGKGCRYFVTNHAT